MICGSSGGNDALSNGRELSLAKTVKEKMRSITNGELYATDDNLHAWALQTVSGWDASTELGEALESCLVDILTCEGNQWDTPMDAFKEDLANLEAAIEAVEGKKRSPED